MEINISKEEMDLLISTHNSAAIRAAAVGDKDKMAHHEARAQHLREIGGYVSALVIDGPPYFEDDQECGYCQRPIGSKHENWCRQ